MRRHLEATTVASLLAPALLVASVAFGENEVRGSRVGADDLVCDAVTGKVLVIGGARETAANEDVVGIDVGSRDFEIARLGGPGDELVYDSTADRIYVISSQASSDRLQVAAACSETPEVLEVGLAEIGLTYEPSSGKLYAQPPPRADELGDSVPSAPLTTGGLEIRQLALPTNDLAYDPVSGMIYASVPSSAGPITGNSIVPIDPVTGVIGTAVFVGSEPGTLAVSDDGQFLYVSLDGAFAVRRFDLLTQTAGPQFALGSDPFTGPFVAEDIEVQPGNPLVIAVSRRNLGFSPRHEGVGIYDDGVVRPNATQDHTGSNRIEFSSGPSLLYGYNNETTEFGFRKIAVDTDGATEISVHRNYISGFGVDIEYHEGVVYSTTGLALEPDTPTVLGTYSGVSFGRGVQADSGEGVVHFLTDSELLLYSLATFIPLDAVTVPGISGTPGSLVRWGPRKLAFRTSGDQVFLVEDPGADLSILKDNGQTALIPGDPVAYTITVSNAGPRDVIGATVTDSFPSDLTSCSWTCVPSAGATCTAGPVAGDVTDVVDLPMGEKVTYTADCTVSPGAGTSISNTATVLPPLAILDPSLGDNSATDADPVVSACGFPNAQVLENLTIDSAQVFTACTSITAGPGFHVVAGGDVTLRAGQSVALTSDSSVGTGGSLVVEIDPSLMP